MRNETKIIITVSLVLILSLAVGVFILSKKQKQQASQNNEQKSEQKKEETDVKTPVEDNSEVKNITIATVSGKVMEISETEISIKSGESVSTYQLDKKVSVLMIKNGKAEKKTLADIKKDQNVSIIINQSNSSVIAIQITSGEKVVF